MFVGDETTTSLISKSENDSMENDGVKMTAQSNILIDTYRERMNSSLFPWLHEKESNVIDNTPEAREYRKKMMLRAVYGLLEN